MHSILLLFSFPATKEWQPFQPFVMNGLEVVALDSWDSSLYSSYMANKLQVLKLLIITRNCNKLQRWDLPQSVHHELKNPSRQIMFLHWTKNTAASALKLRSTSFLPHLV